MAVPWSGNGYAAIVIGVEIHVVPYITFSQGGDKSCKCWKWLNDRINVLPLNTSV